MSLTAQQLKKIDPLHALIAGGFISGTKRPIPLVATRFNVDHEPRFGDRFGETSLQKR